MRLSKRLAAGVLAAVLALSMTACGGSGRERNRGKSVEQTRADPAQQREFQQFVQQQRNGWKQQHHGTHAECPLDRVFQPLGEAEPFYLQGMDATDG